MPKLEDFKVGDRWRDRDGTVTQIVHIRQGTDWPLLGVPVMFERGDKIGTLNDEFPRAYKADGGYTNGDTSGADLVEKMVPTHMGYWNVYKDGSFLGYQTSGPWKDATTAERVNDTDNRASKRMARVKFTFKEGQFDD